MSFSQQEDDIDNDIALLQQVQNALLMAQQARNQNDNVIRQKVKATLRQARQQLALPVQRQARQQLTCIAGTTCRSQH